MATQSASAAAEPARTALAQGNASAAFSGTPRVPVPVNDPNKSYLPGSPERAELKARLEQMSADRIDIPIVIDGRDIRSGRLEQAVMPHDHRHVLADWHVADAEHVRQAIEAASRAQREWSAWPWP